ncbi:MAG: family 16 glycosylhydrolase [Ruminococcus sp.]|nr:family 16 glycosylhydrolase [Ruminococcus sp.]
MKMKKTLTLLLACTMAVSMASCGSSSSAGETSSGKEESSSGEAAKAATPKLDGYELLWSDEFDGDKLNEDIWSYDPHEPGWTNNELQEYTTSTDNVFVKDGVLTLKALKTDKNGKGYYTSGKVKSQGKKDFTYGKVTVSAKVPQGQGLWPAIWMMPTDEQHYGQWPKCGEIDIMEVLGNDTKTAYGTVHYGEPHAQQQKDYKLVVGSFAEKFHEYSVEWEPGEMRWYIDGNEYLKVNDWFTAVDGEDEKPYPAPFDQPFFVQLNLAVGGDWPGNPDSTTNFDKAQFEIDYVRVYQKPSYDKNVKKPEVEMRKALEDGNFIYNGDFKEAEDLTDDKNWKFLLFNEGEGSAKIENGEIVITSKKEGTEEYSVQLVQPELPMIKGKKYKVTFEAYAEKPRDMIVCVSAPTAGWIRYLKDTKLSLTTEKKQFTYEFEVTAKTDPNGRLEFNMGKCGSTETIHITNVRVEEIK